MIRQDLLETLNLQTDSCMYQFLLMMRTYSRFVHDSVKSNADINLQRMGMMIMLRAECEGISQADIAGELQVTPASVTSMLNNMEKEGLIIRKSDSDDKRIKRVYLTENGRKKSDDLLRYVIGISNDFFYNFTNEEKKQFTHLVNKIDNNINSLIIKINEGEEKI